MSPQGHGVKAADENALSIQIDDPKASDPSGPFAYEPPLSVGTKIGEYVVQSLLGEGGFGAVYRASHPVIGKSAAIKVLSRRHSQDPSIVSRFVSEARAANTIRHSGIVDIFSFGQMEDGRPYYVMELLDGMTLHDLLRERGRLSIDEALPIFSQIASALDAAHAAGIAHRDLKPENIFLVRDPDGLRAKLLDFGVAKLLDTGTPRQHRTATGATLGTPSYMAPEQCMGRAVDHRADIYAFGVLTFEALTGALPFRGESTFEVMIGHVNLAPPRPEQHVPDLAQPIGDAILWMLEKDPDLRPQTVTQAVMALSAAATGGGFQRPTASSASRATMNERRAPFASSGASSAASSTVPARRGVTGMIAGAVVLLAIVGGAIFVFGRSEPAPPTSGPITTEAPSPPKSDAKVRVELRGAPAEASIFNGRGDLLLRGSGKLDLAEGTTPVVLFVEAPGFERRRIEVVPDHAQVIDATLERSAEASSDPNKATSPANATSGAKATKGGPMPGDGAKVKGKQKINELEPWE